MELPPPAYPITLDAGRIDSRILERALVLRGEEQSAFVLSLYEDDPAARDGMLRFLSRIGQLGSFLDQPIVRLGSQSTLFEPGAVLEDRFEIVALAGRGGMGEVYRAKDRLSGETLGLKVCRDASALSLNELEFLRDEILLARRISHPNVCRIHELFATRAGVAGSTVFFTMEWLAGQTLAEALSTTGPFTPGITLSIASQIAAGLDAVHRAKIVHRDLKPGNILLVPDGGGTHRAVITDFGLACNVPGMALARDSCFCPERLMGTPDYMSPEQLLGSAVTPATDVYSLALIVYEMATGRKFYGNANLLQTVIRRVTEEQPGMGDGPTTLLPEAWAGPLARALSKEAAQRYQSAGAFVAALRDNEEQRRGFFGGELTRRKLLLGIPAACAVSVASFWTFSRLSDSRAFNRARPSMMLTPITFSSGENGSEAFATTAETLLRKQLNESAYVTVVSRDEMENAWKRTRRAAQSPVFPEFVEPKAARQIALRTGSPYVLYGSISQAGDERVLRLRLELLEGSVVASQMSRSRDFVLHEERDLFDCVHDAASWVRLTVGESKAALAAHFTRPEELTTPSWAALKEYMAGDQEWRAGRPGPAILHLKTALAIDDQFAAACTRLADILMANGQPDEAYTQYATAARLLAARNLTDRESLRGRGLFALDVGLSQEADDIFARYMLEYPRDPLPKFYRAGALNHLDRSDEAEMLFSEAIRLAPQSYSFVMGRACYYLERGRLDEAQRDWERGRAIDARDWTDQIAMAIAFARRDLRSVARSIAHLRTTGSLEFRSKSFALEACLLAEQECWTEAADVLQQGIAFDRRNGASLSACSTKQRMLCQIHLSSGKEEMARCVGLEALEQAPGHESRLQVACVLAQMGELTLASSENCDWQNEQHAADAVCATANTGAGNEASMVPRRICGNTATPPWPIYRYWERRLQLESLLQRKKIADAYRIAATIPAPSVRHIYPDHILRMAKAANDSKLQQSMLQVLRSQVGRWWLEPELNAPGFVQAATKTA